MHNAHSIFFFVSLMAGGMLCGISQSINAETTHNPTIVFQCKDAQGESYFADTPCRDRPSQKLRIEHYSVFNTPIDSRSSARLEEIDNRLARERATRSANQQQNQRRRRLAKQQAKAVCEAARVGLDDLRERKKTGYSLREAGAIAAQESALRQQQEDFCRR